MGDKMDVVYITDEVYMMPTVVSIVSLIDNNKTASGTIYVICDDCSDCSLGKIKEIKTHNWMIETIIAESNKYEELEKELKKRTNTHVSRAALNKFCIEDYLFNVDKVLYIDSDVIVNKSIEELFHTDIDGYYMGAVEDLGNTMLCLRGEESAADRIGLKGDKYFNSGVMLLNLKTMRMDSIGVKLKEYRLNETNYFMDQDALNYCMKEKILELPYVYNFRTPLFYEVSFNDINSIFFKSKYKGAEEMINDMVLLHLSANYKPWNHKMQFFTEIFMDYYRKSPYRDMEVSLDSLEYSLWSQWFQLYKEHRALLKSFDLLLKSIDNMDYRFPFDKIEKGSKIVLYGAGKVGQSFKNLIEKTNYCEVVLWVDGNYKVLNGISSPECIQKTEFDYILVSVMANEYIDEITKSLRNDGVNNKEIITIL